LKFNYIFATDN